MTAHRSNSEHAFALPSNGLADSQILASDARIALSSISTSVPSAVVCTALRTTFFDGPAQEQFVPTVVQRPLVLSLTERLRCPLQIGASSVISRLPVPLSQRLYSSVLPRRFQASQGEKLADHFVEIFGFVLDAPSRARLPRRPRACRASSKATFRRASGDRSS